MWNWALKALAKMRIGKNTICRIRGSMEIHALMPCFVVSRFVCTHKCVVVDIDIDVGVIVVCERRRCRNLRNTEAGPKKS